MNRAIILVLILAPMAAIADGAMEIVSRDGSGRGMLCKSGGKRIIFLEGTPRDMGLAHGRLLGDDIRKMVDKTVYAVGAVYSFQKGTWFLDEMKEVLRRTSGHMPDRFMQELDALAEAAGITKRDARYANLFPEMFHCSGFAVRGEASEGGRVLHARVLDYMTGIGLQDLAVLMVFMPEGHNNWLSVGYSGFTGTVTAMNDKGLAIGELGGRGEGKWDGVPMSFLLRDVMERAGTVPEAVSIIEKGPRTCEYYYVITDRQKNMVGIHARPEKVDILEPGQQHPRLPPVKPDTIVFSAGGRLDVLCERIGAAYGKIDVKKMIEIIKRPVAMKSNLHNAIFAPETLGVWYADADERGRACDEPYVHFNLAKLIEYYRNNKEPKKHAIDFRGIADGMSSGARRCKVGF